MKKGSVFLTHNVFMAFEADAANRNCPSHPRDVVYMFQVDFSRQSCFYKSLSDHRLRGSASTVLTATGQVNNRRWRILTPHRIETHQPTATKFRTIDYVRERTP